ncbi:hypothetical protein NC651_019050 [Populus alba x Populus x berolinensis]|nr:hypothetical protein NC651_019050 [Populus alba x Populus x berolinensis]
MCQPWDSHGYINYMLRLRRRVLGEAGYRENHSLVANLSLNLRKSKEMAPPVSSDVATMTNYNKREYVVQVLMKVIPG